MPGTALVLAAAAVVRAAELEGAEVADAVRSEAGSGWSGRATVALITGSDGST